MPPIKLDPKDVLALARSRGSAYPFDSFGENIVHALCEALAAADPAPSADIRSLREPGDRESAAAWRAYGSPLHPSECAPDRRAKFKHSMGDPDTIHVLETGRVSVDDLRSFLARATGAMCEALAAATSEAEPKSPEHLPSAPPPAGNVFMRVERQPAQHCTVELYRPSTGGAVHTCNREAGHLGRHEWCGEREVARAAEARALDAMRLREPGDAGDAAAIALTPEGEVRGTLDAVKRVHHYEARIARALECADRARVAYETEADRVDDMVDALRGGTT